MVEHYINSNSSSFEHIRCKRTSVLNRIPLDAVPVEFVRHCWDLSIAIILHACSCNHHIRNPSKVSLLIMANRSRTSSCSTTISWRIWEQPAKISPFWKDRIWSLDSLVINAPRMSSDATRWFMIVVSNRFYWDKYLCVDCPLFNIGGITLSARGDSGIQ